MRSFGAFLLFTFVPFLTEGQVHSTPPLSWEFIDRFFLLPSDSLLQLSREFVVHSSETVTVDSARSLRPSVDYSIEERHGAIRFHQQFIDSLRRIPGNHSVEVRYRALPLTFQREYALRKLILRKDSVGMERKTAVPTQSRISSNDIFGPDLQKSGSIFRGFSLGSNRDLSLSSGFRMQLAGKLSQDVDIVAALTDENSPIQPEGTTQTLQEVDKVYVEFKHPSFSATLGDFNMQVNQRTGGEFGRASRKLQGAQGVARSGNIIGTGLRGELSATGATARGKFNTNQFQGIEGSQGPYRLAGRNGERRIIVIAGTERVYLNGELMKRGEADDYTIDYSSAEVTFASPRLITSASRIVVDFEYSDRQYERNLVGLTASSELKDRWIFNAVFLQESDDIDSPIDVTLDETARELLRQSGSDRLKASLPGARFVGRDSVTNAGRGQYFLRDTTIGAGSYGIFVYSPGDSGAVYSVSFSSVEQVPQDSAGYVRVGLGHFEFAGLGKGNYLPLQLLPLPQLHRVVDINSSAQITRDLFLSGEFAMSQFDRNRFSTVDDAENDGLAYRFGATFSPRSIVIGAWKLGEADFSLSTRSVGRSFVSADRVDDIEFNRKWNLDAGQRSDEDIREASLAYRPKKGIEVTGGYGLLEQKAILKSRRMYGGVGLNDSTILNAQYHAENIERDEAQKRSSWLRQRGSVEYDAGPVTPGMRVEAEEKTTGDIGKDSLAVGSFRFVEIAPRARTRELFQMRVAAEVQVRAEDSVIAGRLRKGFKSVTQLYSWSLREWNTISSTLSLSLRTTRFSDALKQRGNSNSEVVLVRSQTRFMPLQRAVETDLFYEFSNQRSSRLERVFVRVAPGNGNYRYKGDVNGNSLADENEFELTRFDGDYVALLIPSEALYPIVDLKASARIRFNPSRLFSEQSSPWSKIFSAVSAETYGRVDEKTSESDTRRIYLLDFSAFQNDRTTIAGSNLLSQDLHLFEYAPEFSVRFRFQQRKGFIQLVSANERSYLRERSVRIRSQLVREIANQTEYSNKVNRVGATGPTLRERDIVSDVLNSDFSYRPEREWEIGFKLEVGQATDRFPVIPTTADWNEQALRVVYGFVTRGQVRGEIKREEVSLLSTSADPNRVLPFELTAGKVVGKTFQWSAVLDYRINQNVQVMLNYNGRTEGKRSPVHFARAEARAFF